MAVIYMDHAATTSVSDAVLEKMLPYFQNRYGNPGTLYGLGRDAATAVNGSRMLIAGALGADPNEIYFTSGGTESDNQALIGVFEEYSEKGKHIITTPLEHPAVLNTLEYLKTRGAVVTYLSVDGEGRIDLNELENAIREDTILITVMSANNEIGTIYPVAEIGKLARKHHVIFHTDAVQAFGKIEMDVNKLGVDLLSVSAHKINGPKGCGFLYIREGVLKQAFMHGGHQQRGRRAGTENVPGIVGLGAAAEEACHNLWRNAEKERKIRDYIIERIEREIEGSHLCGSRSERLSGNAHFCFEGVEGSTLLFMMDRDGILLSGGSACSIGEKDPSHVLLAIGVDRELAKGAVRISLGPENTMEEADRLVSCLKKNIDLIRDIRK